MRKTNVKTGKKLILVLSILLILAVAAGSSLAYVFMKTDPLENTFRNSVVSCRVNSGTQIIDVTNTGDIDAYIRAAIVVNWVDEDGNTRGIKPNADQYDLEINTEKWYSSGGFYYCLEQIEPNENTPDLVTGVTVLDQPQGYFLQVEVAAEAIQAEGVNGTGVNAVSEAWKINLPGGLS